jgi:DNA polymerase-1
LHPMYSLNTVKTFRGSGSYPNPQNFPNRDKRRARLVRTAFIPRSDDHVILEMDMSGAEVRTSACYHKDPTMISYIERNHDYHKDLASQCFKLPPEQVTKLVRGTAKNMFVFASFYGDWHVNIAQNLWTAVKKDKLTTADGVPLYDHLAENGLPTLGAVDRNTIPGTFGHHIKEVYDDFWTRRFHVYSQWKVEWFNKYLETGWFQTLTGFVCKGIFKRNEAINYPIQGSSFHCLLWVLIEMDKWLRKYKMQTKIIGQIHDSILFDAHRKELRDVAQKCHELMIEAIRRAWDWIIVPLEVEAEVGEQNWYQKTAYPLAA